MRLLSMFKQTSYAERVHRDAQPTTKLATNRRLHTMNFRNIFGRNLTFMCLRCAARFAAKKPTSDGGIVPLSGARKKEKTAARLHHVHCTLSSSATTITMLAILIHNSIYGHKARMEGRPN